MTLLRPTGCVRRCNHVSSTEVWSRTPRDRSGLGMRACARRSRQAFPVRASNNDGDNNTSKQAPKGSVLGKETGTENQALEEKPPVAKRGFFEGKTWSWYFEQEAVPDDKVMNERMKELSHLDKLMAIILSETAIPGTLAVIGCSILSLHPFAYWHADTKTFAQACVTVLPLLLVDVYLLLQRPRTLADLRAKSEEEVDDDDSLVERGEDGSRTIKFVYGLQDAVDDYSMYARNDLSVLVSHTPSFALAPAVVLGSAAQELLYRGTLLSALTLFLDRALRENNIDAPQLWWDASTSNLSNAQLLSLPPPPMALAGEMALAIYIVGSLALQLMAFGTDSSIEGVIPVEESSITVNQKSTDLKQVTVLPTKGPAVTVQRLNNVKPQGQNDDSSSTDEDDEEVTLDIHMLNSAEDVEGLRMLAHSSLRSFQWVFTGNLFLPVVSAVLAELLWVLLVKHADPELRDDMSAGANDYV
eukprot:CAMPEP_0114308904 /NCGR_PEP_ID=MMETSP0059-20121206/18338_1 /TAXON_ID=36894 /ORGANISM="Pyramimonas parkeae, Strain CCMP726" /LENGTH=471 /DNA_ID=CAMNT_0001432639 /DNA_START=39 /DNA_END=1454 /DNA_ORIENTATION=+